MNTNPDSLDRIIRILRLMTELSRTDLNTMQAAQALDCSPAAARLCLLELADAGVVRASNAPAVNGRPGIMYSLYKDSRKVREYLGTLSGARNGRRQPSGRPNGRGPFFASWPRRGDGVD